MKKFFTKLKTDFSFRKKVIITAVIVVVVICGVSLIKINGSSLFASVMHTRPANNVPVSRCDANMLYACANCNTSENQLSCAFGLSTCPYACQSTGVTNTWETCSPQCIPTACNDPAIVYSCSQWYLRWCPLACQTSGNGYGYGYGYGGASTGYGYGYGYSKLSLLTKQPYLYLLNVFVKYPKSVYDAVVNKIWFKISKFYNKKEFKPTIVPSK